MLATDRRRGYFIRVLLPLILIVLATAAAGALAYGTHPALAEQAHGLETIMLARRLLWPLVILSLVSCIALLGLVIANKRRAWWLIGLAPVLALFYHRFGPPGAPTMWILDAPTFAAADEEPIPHDDWWVVGVVFQDNAYALPYWALYATPVVFITDYDKRMVVMWSPHADRATAYSIAREFRARDLEIAATPADSILLYDQRLGQFIVTLTSLTPTGERPVGLLQPIPTYKMTWAAWKKSYPQSKILRGSYLPDAPIGPVLPRMAGKTIDGIPAETRVAMIGTTPLSAIPHELLGKRVNNVTAGDKRLLIVRDPHTNAARVFDRNVKEDLFPTFTPATDSRHVGAIMKDSDSDSWWTPDGKAIAGPLKDTQMKELPIEEGLYWGPMKYWIRGLQLAK